MSMRQRNSSTCGLFTSSTSGIPRVRAITAPAPPGVMWRSMITSASRASRMAASSPRSGIIRPRRRSRTRAMRTPSVLSSGGCPGARFTSAVTSWPRAASPRATSQACTLPPMRPGISSLAR
jgi:hypothetical protein